MNLNFSFLSKYWPMFVRGAGTTLILSFFTVLIGLIIGVFLALLRLGKFKPLSFLSAAYTEFIRGTPLMVQIFFIFYALPQMGFKIPNITGLGFDFPRFASGILAMGLNSGAYTAEIIRGGIMSIDGGQSEAGRSLGFNYIQTMYYIVMPQTIKTVLPALGNELVVLLKETSIAGYIAMDDLTKGGNIIRSITYNAFLPLLAVALIYLVVVLVLSYGVNCLERRLRNSDH